MVTSLETEFHFRKICGWHYIFKRRKMASQQLPIRLQSVADLPQLGIGQNSFKFGALTIESEKYICIRDEGTDGNTQVVVVELENANNVVRRTMKAEAAIMNP
jgi:clathrin heavy chain